MQHPPPTANKTDAGNGSKAICRVSNVSRSPSPDPKRLGDSHFHNPKAMNITVGQLIEALQRHNPEASIHFEGVTFFQVTQRSSNLVQIEFNEPIDQITDERIVFVKCPL